MRRRNKHHERGGRGMRGENKQPEMEGIRKPSVRDRKKLHKGQERCRRRKSRAETRNKQLTLKRWPFLISFLVFVVGHRRPSRECHLCSLLNPQLTRAIWANDGGEVGKRPHSLAALIRFEIVDLQARQLQRCRLQHRLCCRHRCKDCRQGKSVTK